MNKYVIFFLTVLIGIIITGLYCGDDDVNSPQIITSATTNADNITTTTETTDGTTTQTITSETTTATAMLHGDDCSSLIDINLEGTSNNGVFEYFDVVDDSTADYTGCAGEGKDVVVKYTPSATNINIVDIDVCQMINTDTVMWIGTTCGTYDQTYCIDDGCSSEDGPSKLSCIPVSYGTTYYIVVKAKISDGDLSGYLAIRITENEYVDQGGNTCNDAFTITDATSVDGGYLWNINSDECNLRKDHYFSCDVSSGGDVVIEYVAASNSTLQITGTWLDGFSNGYLGLEILKDNCDSGDVMFCQSTSSYYVPSTKIINATLNVSAGETYYFWLGEGYSGQYLPEISLFAKEIVGLSGDNCSDVIDMNIDGTLTSNTWNYTGYVNDATDDYNSSNCSGGGTDVVIKYTPSSTSINQVSIDNCNMTGVDTVVFV